MTFSRSSSLDVEIGPEEPTGDWAVQRPSVVHSSHGRLRIHLPHWDGANPDSLIAGIQLLPAVTRAEANAVTGNVLILFEPRQASSPDLLQALSNLRLEPLASLPAATVEVDRALAIFTPEAEPVQGEFTYVTGVRRVIYKGLGWASVGMAIVGAIMPGIPTAPFVILAGYFFIRSSPEAHQWLRRSRWFGGILRDWEAHHGIRQSVRNFALALIGGSMVITLLLGLPSLLTISIVACQVIGLAIVLRLRVVEPVALEPA